MKATITDKRRALNFSDASLIDFFIKSDIKWFTSILREISKKTTE